MHLDREAMRGDWDALGAWFRYGTHLSWLIVVAIALILLGSAVIGRTVTAFH